MNTTVVVAAVVQLDVAFAVDVDVRGHGHSLLRSTLTEVEMKEEADLWYL